MSDKSLKTYRLTYVCQHCGKQTSELVISDAEGSQTLAGIIIRGTPLRTSGAAAYASDRKPHHCNEERMLFSGIPASVGISFLQRIELLQP